MRSIPQRSGEAPRADQCWSHHFRLAGSLVGGIRETQEMLEFCAEHDIIPDIELIPFQRVNEAYERLLRGDVRYRFVVDNSTLEG